MLKKWVCSYCDSEFARRWNMERHVKIMHGQPYRYTKERGFSKRLDNNIFQPLMRDGASNNHDFSTSEDWFTKNLSEILRLIKANAEFNASIVKNRTYSLPNVEYLQRELNYRTTQLSEIFSNYWLIHRSTIKGISGFYCRRCETFGFDYVKNPGYDKTYEARHVCDEIKVKSIHACSIRKVDIDSKDNMIAEKLLQHVNFFMPGAKYLTGLDVSKAFETYSKATSYEFAKGFFGIPDRYPLFRFNNPEILSWMTAAFTNPDKRTKLEESELVDFLGKVKSSYAMFEIPTPYSPKMIFLALTS